MKKIREAPDERPTRWLDTIWMIVQPGDRGVIYGTVAETAPEAWRLLEDGELMGTGHCRRTLFPKGFRARKVQLWRELPLPTTSEK